MAQQHQVHMLTKSALFIALMAVSANLTAFITVGAVPLTFQTVIAALAGIILGKRNGALAIFGYVLLGIFGAPVFAGFSGGLQSLLSPTFGFLISFAGVAFITGKLTESLANLTKQSSFFAVFTGLALNYLFGVPYLVLYTGYLSAMNQEAMTAAALSMIPFFIKDVVFAFITAGLAYKLRRYRFIQNSFKKESRLIS
ncbi:biotin transporter BioY [Salisediminibacterium halotolerans]|uniref:Biotin transporter n=1 Tax=Salisediminibacterium halotolerans TaxID=517425 RepID=A0A1H9WS46_9BACI|nr:MULTISPECIES: biotin transporter BioY [Salisediminibacterium]RLJ75374.1 biotin transport system substrate-specific component [Actinophytocola xinjiangensis]RPE89228.1 biotin transport system substrate-specific component [Salisediminibacterium halotolerans]TWG35987.1 biotin transport system substrate-specific component [Salisediminibacterium halotolerans]SES36497.1 biotin transport system substrate-specific component [Salisediminibacterium haloalkalitolerans]GEL07782.1 BioY family transporte